MTDSTCESVLSSDTHLLDPDIQPLSSAWYMVREILMVRTGDTLVQFNFLVLVSRSEILLLQNYH